MLSPEHEDSLVANRLACLSCLRVTEKLLSALRKDYSFTEDMVEEVVLQKKTHEKVGTLLTMMGKRSEKAFCTLIRGLVDDDQDEPAKLLDKKMALVFIKLRDEKRFAEDGSGVSGISVHPVSSRQELGDDDSNLKPSQRQQKSSQQQVSNDVNTDDNTDGGPLASTVDQLVVTLQNTVTASSAQSTVAQQNPVVAPQTQPNSMLQGSVTAPYQPTTQFSALFQPQQVPVTWILTQYGYQPVPLYPPMPNPGAGDAATGNFHMQQFPFPMMPNYVSTNGNVGGNVPVSSSYMQQPVLMDPRGYMQTQLPLYGGTAANNVTGNSTTTPFAQQQQPPGPEPEPAPGNVWRPNVSGNSTTVPFAQQQQGPEPEPAPGNVWRPNIPKAPTTTFSTVSATKPATAPAVSATETATVPAVDPAVTQTATLRPLTHPADETVQKVVSQPLRQAPPSEDQAKLKNIDPPADELDSREQQSSSLTTKPQTASSHTSQSLEELEEAKEEQQYKAIVSWPDGSASLEGLISQINMTKPKPPAGAYPMNRQVHGRAIIINNKFFLKKERRAGTEHDMKNLTALFTKFGYKVVVENQKSKEEIEAILERERTVACSDCDAFILVTLSHGKEGFVLGADEKEVSIDYITEQFDGKHCSALRRKPKIFLIQACQGETNSPHMQCDGPDDEFDSEPCIDDSNQLEIKLDIHEKADMFVAYATPKGYSAWRYCELGSCFIRTLVYVFAHYAHQKHLCDMFTILNRLMSTLKATDKKGKEINLIAHYDNSFRMDMFFHADLTLNPLP